MPTVLVIEDDEAIRSALDRGLRGLGHHVLTEATGLGGVNRIVAKTPAVAILDLGLPDIDGSDLLRMIRSVSTVPIIVATARDTEDSIIASLDAGADDYVVKPFSVEQIDARIRAVLRRLEAAAAPAEIVVGGLVIDRHARQVSVDGRELTLSRKEYDLLELLASRAGRIVTKRQLLAEVWQQPLGGAEKTVDVHLSWLRRKLGETGTDPRYLHSVRGVGVKLVDPTAEPTPAVR
jgi:DNA-binding response OmpR family regulator